MNDDAEGASLFSTMHLKPLVDAMGELAGVKSMLFGAAFNIAAHVAWGVGSSQQDRQRIDGVEHTHDNGVSDIPVWISSG